MLIYNMYKRIYYTVGLLIIKGEGVNSTMMSRHFKITLTTRFFAAKAQQTRGIEPMVV